MDFLIGFGFILFILISTLIVDLISRVFNAPEYAGLPVLVMLMFDGLCCLAYYYTAVEFIENLRPFKMGISASFALGTLLRVLYLAYTQIKKV